MFMFEINKIKTRDNDFLDFARQSDKTIKEIYYMGRLPEKHVPTVTIVGTRKPTAYGREITLKLAESLARRGVIVVSGLALGHDALAHQGALSAGGITVAVLGSALPDITPRTNRALGEAILTAGGAILSEFAPGSKVYKPNFLQRNRIVAALADVIIVVEANRHSGTLNTVGHALAQGKEVMAVPGNVTSPLSEGCNRLIQQGATPLLGLGDVLEKLGLSDENKDRPEIKFANKQEEKIYQLIAEGVRGGDQLQERSGIDPAEFNTALTMLEIQGLIRNLGANNCGIK